MCCGVGGIMCRARKADRKSVRTGKMKKYKRKDS
jgi:hypothetical protein